MDYYGNNDFRDYQKTNDYLAHHGILGMHWGVRRFQPYSVHPRKGGEGGKEVGEAKKRKNRDNDESTVKENVLRHAKEPSVLTEDKKTKLAEFLAKISPRIKENIAATKDYTITDKNNNKVGVIETYIDNKNTLNVVWLNVKSKYEGNGYGQSAMRLVIDNAKKTGMKKVTLEVPGDSPNARHIYEKLGFKATRELSSPDEDAVWGGLTAMELDLRSRR